MQVTIELPDADSHDCRAFNSILARVADKWSVLIVVLLIRPAGLFGRP